MKLKTFLTCEHDIEPDTSMTCMRCEKCGVDANVINYVVKLQTVLKKIGAPLEPELSSGVILGRRVFMAQDALKEET